MFDSSNFFAGGRGNAAIELPDYLSIGEWYTNYGASS
jgi:hypothetical protein